MADFSPISPLARHQEKTAVGAIFDTWRDARRALDDLDGDALEVGYQAQRQIEDTMFATPCEGPLDVLALVVAEFRFGDAAETPYQTRIAAEAMRIIGHE